MNLRGSNQVWSLIDIPEGVKPIGSKWVYKLKLGAEGRLLPSKPDWWRKDILNDLGSTLIKPTCP
ncbi:UNVERIFIED_CONTAM: hypothetical protein Sradi_6476100 [Sesamum radiatum]|uniref:Reverse transcriptase Ty1/copia-type domain-containing protein n=1 Tax=Sesamum radiatum TaxID=300843 RepID=A0AAW2K6I6_SESRA